MFYRVFDERKYAEEFIKKGLMRFSTLEYYKNIEDSKRADRTEGHGELERDGEKLIVDVKNKTITPVPGVETLFVDGNEKGSFVFCFSSPESCRLQDLPIKFGKYVVRVKNTEQLFKDTQYAIHNDPNLKINLPELKSALVRYDKKEYQAALTGKEIDILGWSQKPSSYSKEFELRYRFWFPHELIDSPNHYTINLNKELKYCELITRQVQP